MRRSMLTGNESFDDLQDAAGAAHASAEDNANVQNEETFAASTVGEIVDNMGFGRHQLRTLLVCGGFQFGIIGPLWITQTLFIEDDLQKFFQISSRTYSFSRSAFFVGWGLGTMAFCRLADSYGRRTVLVVTMVVGVAAAMCTSAATQFWHFCAARAVTGAVVGGQGALSYILTIETAPSQLKGMMGVAVNAFFPIGLIAAPTLSYLLRKHSWQAQVVVINAVIPAAALPALLGLVRESARWAGMLQGAPRALRLLAQIAAVNGRPLPPHTGLPAPEGPAPAPAPEPAPRVLASLLAPPLLPCSLVMLYAWFAVTLVYYGLTFSAGKMAGSVYLNGVLLGAVELPAHFLAYAFVELPGLGRRGTQTLGFAMAGVALLVMSLPGLTSPACQALAVIGKGSSTLAFDLVYLFAGELFPTTLRGSALGMCNVASRIGGVCAPFLLNVPRYNIVFGVLSVVGMLGTLLLPETRGKVLQDTMQQTTRLHRDQDSDKASLIDATGSVALDDAA